MAACWRSLASAPTVVSHSLGNQWKSSYSNKKQSRWSYSNRYQINLWNIYIYICLTYLGIIDKLEYLILFSGWYSMIFHHGWYIPMMASWWTPRVWSIHPGWFCWMTLMQRVRATCQTLGSRPDQWKTPCDSFSPSGDGVRNPWNNENGETQKIQQVWRITDTFWSFVT